MTQLHTYKPLVVGSRPLVVAAVLGFLTLVTGCTTPYRAMPMDERYRAHNQPHQEERNGLVLAATLVDDESRASELFHHPLPKHNIIPVILHLENTGDRSMTLRLEKVRLVLENGAELAPATASEIIEDSREDMWPAYAGAPLIVPYFLTRRDIQEFNFQLTEDYRSKALPAFLRVTPIDDPSSRVLFFRVGDERMQELRNNPVLQVPVDFESLPGDQGGVEKEGKREFFHLALD